MGLGEQFAALEKPIDLRFCRKWMPYWSAILIVSLTLRFCVLALLSGRALGGDSAIYIAMGQNIAAGYGIVVHDPNILPNMRVTYPPLYPILLAGTRFLFPLTLPIIMALNTIFDVLCARGIATIGSRLNQPRAGVIASALYLIWPVNIILAPVARKEALVSLLVVWLIIMLLRLIERPSTQSSIAYGFVSALLALTQPALAPLPAILALAAMTRFESRRAWLRSMAVGSVAATITLAPWWVRNWVLFARFIPFTAAGGYGLWVGATPLGNGTWIEPPVRFRVGDELVMSAALGREAQRLILEHPFDFLIHCVTKLFNAFASDMRGPLVLYWAEPQRHLLAARLIGFIGTVIHLFVLEIAIATTVLKPSNVLSRFLWACFAQILIFGMWFEFDQRHRYFLTPILLLTAASGLLLALTGARQTSRSA